VPLGVLLVIKALKVERYVVIKAYRFTVFERSIIYCVSTLSLHREGTNSMPHLHGTFKPVQDPDLD